MESYFALLSLIVSPVLIVGVGLWIVRWFQGEHRRKSPVSRKVCRYAGFTLTKEVEDLNERLSNDLTMLLLIPAVTVGVSGIGFVKLSGLLTWIVFLTIYLGAIGFFVFRLFKTSQILRRNRLGLAGEQLVGHQLTELLRVGFYVFHDFPTDFGNIDHVVVGPPGVFAIETKYKRKVKNEKDGHKISFNNQVIRFPDAETSKPLEQAKRQANELSNQLEKVFGGVPVTPVIVYLGWYVTREAARTEVQVMNDKQVVSWLSKEGRSLDDQTVKRIAAFLEEKCRDVEL
ncbi:MAG: hypothetical protein CMO55_20390 [Verrucomicrobiales bacterium]|nr:hypothetical protein [Verrucomicrobiales bacterium]